jgi:pyrroline-5-carboxylate reductase
MSSELLAILGVGNIGRAIAQGLKASGRFQPENIILTRRSLSHLEDLKEQGFQVQSDNLDAVRRANTIILAIRPLQYARLIEEIKPALDPSRHQLLSVVSGVSINESLSLLGQNFPFVRVMPNTAIAVRESMTCLAARPDSHEALEMAKSLFDTMGQTQIIDEEFFTSATALCACGAAFFLRAIRAASQGGIEIGFHAEEALAMATQTARGAASLLIEASSHPEAEIDRITTPRGCTIAGLNQMEHEGFSSAMIKGIVTSAKIAGSLYEEE